MRPLAFITLSALIFSRAPSQTNCGALPPDDGGRICYGYAMAKAFGQPSTVAMEYRPGTAWIPSFYFKWSPAANFKEGDIVQWGVPEANGQNGLSAANAHAAIVISITAENTPDGYPLPGYTGRYRDEDQILPPHWNNILLAEVDGESASETIGISLSAVDSREAGRNRVYKGYWTLRDEFKCTMTFSNSMNAGHIYVGKDDEGKYFNRASGFSDKFTHNAVIPAKAETTQSISGVKWNFEKWRKGTEHFSWNNEVSVTVDRYNASYIAQYGSGGTPSSFVQFENRSDNLSIYSIIRVGGEDKLSKTQPYPLNTSATAYQYLLSDRVHYTFSQWSTGSTNLTIAPSTAGTYIAHYNFDYVLPPDEINPYNNSVGQPIKITWRRVGNAYAYVDTIEVWRKVKNVHNAMIIARLSPTATQFIDNEYTLTSGYTDDLIDYDIRLRYKTPARTVTSAANWFTVFGEGGFAEKAKDQVLVLSSTAPESFTFSSYPNPFNPSTTISYVLEKSSFVEMSVFDMTGSRVKVLSPLDRPSGMNSLIWDATDNDGKKLSSGTYILQIAVYPHDGSPAFTAARKLLLAR
jgi:hypothetical protein